MANLTLAIRDEREDSTNYWQLDSEVSSALHNILGFSSARDGDGQDDDDDYWHP